MGQRIAVGVQGVIKADEGTKEGLQGGKLKTYSNQ